MTSLIHRCADQPARLTVAVPARPGPPDAARGYFAQEAADRCATLSPRQREALVLLSKGVEHRQSAAIMGVSSTTARDYRRDIYAKLEVNSAVEAAVLAAKAGLV